MGAFELLQNKIDDIRFRGFGGTTIQMHRAIKQVKLSRANVVLAVCLPPIFNLLLLALLGPMLAMWEAIFGYWTGSLAPHATLGTHVIDLGRYIALISYPQLSAEEPGFYCFMLTVFVSLLLYLLTFRVTPDHMLPLMYIVRACMIIQATALLYFYLWPGRFPHRADAILADALTMSVYFMFLIPWLLGLTFYIFNFTIWQKMGATVLMLLYFAVALPMQYLAHALILHHFSLLFLPILYLVFGIFIDIMMFVALYSWAMSWESPGRPV